MKISKPEFIAKAKLLSAEEQDRLLSRMEGKLPKRFLKDKINREEAMAIQLELEDDQLEEWRQRMREIKDKSEQAKKKEMVKKAVKPATKTTPTKAVSTKKPTITEQKAVAKSTPVTKSADAVKPKAAPATKSPVKKHEVKKPEVKTPVVKKTATKA